MKLFTYPNNPRANKALIAAEYAGVTVEVVNVEMGKTNKTKEYMALNPWGKVPTLETDDGEGIWESNAIARYVARLSENNLFGTTPTEYGQVEQWIDWVRGELELAASVWLYPIYGIIPDCQQATCKAKEDIKRLMCVLNFYLESRSYFVGESVTLADIVIACTLVPLYTKVFDPEFRVVFQNVNKWFMNMIDQPNFKKVQNDINLCEVMAVAGQPAAEPKEKEEDQQQVAVSENPEPNDDESKEDEKVEKPEAPEALEGEKEEQNQLNDTKASELDSSQ